MLTFTEIQNRLQAANLRAVHRATGVGYQTICRIANGTSQSTSSNRLEKLSRYFEELERPGGGE